MIPSFRVIFVEDERSQRESLRFALRHVEWIDAEFCADAAQAMDALASGRADALVTDLGLPGMSGEELLREVRARWPDVLRVVLTGTRTHELEDLAHAVLLKPASRNEVQSALHSLLVGRSRSTA